MCSKWPGITLAHPGSTTATNLTATNCSAAHQDINVCPTVSYESRAGIQDASHCSLASGCSHSPVLLLLPFRKLPALATRLHSAASLLETHTPLQLWKLGGSALTVNLDLPIDLLYSNTPLQLGGWEGLHTMELTT
jgi:hypothetical protein